MFNTNAQCYQNISQVLLTSAFILWPTCTRGFGIREKIRCGLRFFGLFLCGFAVFGPPLRPPHIFFKSSVIVIGVFSAFVLPILLFSHNADILMVTKSRNWNRNVVKSNRVNCLISCTRWSVLYLFEFFVVVGICVQVNAWVV